MFTSFFQKNAFINCVFSNCEFYNSPFKDCSFSGNLFFRNNFKEKTSEALPQMIKCDLGPFSALGPFAELREKFPTLSTYVVKSNLSVLDIGMRFKDCNNIYCLKEADKVPDNLSHIDLKYVSARTDIVDHKRTQQDIYSNKETQPIPKHNWKNREKPVRFMSAGL